MNRSARLASGALLTSIVLLAAAAVPAILADDDDPADEQASPANPIAVCDVWDLTYELALSDRYTERRAEYERAHDELIEMWEEAEEIRERAEDLDPDSDEYEKIHDEYMEIYERYREESESVKEQRDRIFGAVVTDARAIVVESAGAVAEDLGYAYVIATATMPDRHDPRPDSYSRSWQRHLADQAVFFPEGADITHEVRDDLNLE